MIKIGIINIANYNYNLASIIPYTIAEGIELIDFCDTVETGCTNFLKAINSDDLDFVWFLSGGTLTINIMNTVLEVTKTKNTRLIGSSDATHAFINFMNESMIETYYYLNFLDFLKSHNQNTLKIAELMLSPDNFQFQIKQNTSLYSDLTIIGGHSIISTFYLDLVKKSSSNKYAYFWEHHGAKFETVEYFIYWLKVLIHDCHKYNINEIIIGYSYIYNVDEGRYYTCNEQQTIIKEVLKDDFSIIFLDQRVHPIYLY